MENPEGRIIGIDLGQKRVGVSISDAMGMYAHPLKVVEFKSDTQLQNCLVGLAQEHGARTFVVGLPKNMDGTLGFAAKRAQSFAAKLKRRTGFPVFLLDERLTTSQADKEMIGLGKTRKRRRSVIDAVAAVLILETYLSRLRCANTEIESERL